MEYHPMRYDLIRYQRMRAVFIVLMLINLGVFGVGQGWFGTPRAEAGRTAANRLPVPLNADAVKLGPAQLQNR
jgi:hypothetical protein